MSDFPCGTVFRTGLWLILLIPAFSCDGDDGYIDPDRIYTIYQIDYQTEEGHTLIEAGFRVLGADGEPVELAGEASITFNGDPIPYHSPSGFHRKEIEGPVHSGTFLYTDFDGDTYTTETPFLPSIHLPDIFILSSSTDYLIAWEGDPVLEGERIMLRIEGAADFLEKITTQPGDTAIFVSGSEIKEVDLFGSGTILLRRSHSKFLSLGTATGGELTMRFSDSGFVEFSD